MSLVKPILNLINSFDSTQSCLVTFVANSGDQIYANEINIFRNSDNVLIYNNKTIVPTFSLQQTIPANKLTNGVTYKIQLRTYNSTGQYSLWSDWILFSCYSNPVIDISNIINNGIINNQTYTPQGTYSQAQGDLLQSYQYTLYDSNMMQITDSGLLFDGLLQYPFTTGFDNNKNYSIKLLVTSQHGMSSSIVKTFKADYAQPTFSNLITLTNNPSQASVDVQVEAIRILGKIGSGNPTIENGDWLNVTNSSIYFDNNNGFQIPNGDWSLQIWLSNLVDTKTLVKGVLEGTLITKLYGQNNVTFKLEYYDGAFHLYKFIGDFLFSHYKSNVINATVNDVVYLFCQSINDRISLRCEIISNN